MYITVLVNPHSRFEKIEKISDKEYRISFNVVPEKGRANQKVIDLLANYFDIPKSQIEIKLGRTAREKVVFVDIQ
jgi:uncharacterized protein YggU (UPF0235/DUF167 family)